MIGGWRTIDEAGKPVDASGDHAEREKDSKACRACGRCCWKIRSSFRARVTEKLMAYALGRRVEYYDRPAMRKIVRDAGGAELPLVVAHCGDCRRVPAFLMRAQSRTGAG